MKKKSVIKALETIMKLYKGCEPPPFDLWKNHGERQGYRDSLECFKREGVISDYNLQTGEITYE